MNKSIGIYMLALSLYACNTKQPSNEVTRIDSTIVVVPADSNTINKDMHYYWTASWENKKGMQMKKSSVIPADSLTAGNIIRTLNEIYPEIQLRIIHISNDSIFLRIDKSNYLTQQSGSSGAQAYLAEVTYNLTELPGINNVDLMFKAGDHASPGTYTRLDFVPIQKTY